jgi:quercetin dioxygenase-like cupin family protein
MPDEQPALQRVVRVSQGVDFRGLGGLVKRLIYPQTTGCRNATMAMVFLNPGEAVVRHRHVEEEFYYVLDGRGEIYLDDGWFPIEPGMAIFIPSNTIHGQRCTGDETLRILAVVAPPFASPASMEIVEDQLAEQAGPRQPGAY